MVRVTKNFDERKNEILDKAQGLFMQKGFEKTTITDVIEQVEIAKGTFYHYFKSKDDLLDQIINRIVNNIDAIIQFNLEREFKNATEKLNTIYKEIAQYKAYEKNVMIMMTNALYNDKNIILRTKLNKKKFNIIAPSLAAIISEGIKNREFEEIDPEIATGLILNMGMVLIDEFAGMVLKNVLNEKSKEKYLKYCVEYNKAVERILGAEKGSIDFIEIDVIKKFFE